MAREEVYCADTADLLTRGAGGNAATNLEAPLPLMDLSAGAPENSTAWQGIKRWVGVCCPAPIRPAPQSPYIYRGQSINRAFQSDPEKMKIDWHRLVMSTALASCFICWLPAMWHPNYARRYENHFNRCWR